jgi:predicted  nucleic acid-binding Zn-ribbon protein
MPLHQVSTARTAPGEKKSDLDVVREAIEDIQGQLAGLRKRAADMEGLTGESDAAQQLQAVSRGMANAVRRIRKLEEDVRLLHEAQLATVQDVLGLTDRMRLVEHRGGGSQQVDG